MPSNIRGNKTKKSLRKEDQLGGRIDAGPYVAKIKSNEDPLYMGALWVWIEDFGYNDENSPDGWIKVNYCSPFCGVTDLQHNGQENKFKNTQQAYGMHMVPPDINSLCLVTFAGGMPNKGYVIGFIQDAFMNHMVPGMAADEEWVKGDVDTTGFTSGVDALPVAEFNKKDPTPNLNKNWQKIKKPVHKYQFEMLQEQGLIQDKDRGLTTSAANRETPSHVFGISTPGRPLDSNLRDVVKDNLDIILKNKDTLSAQQIKQMTPKSRKGGHSFVMDDGDYNGDNQLMRLRSATGHQILLHDTKDLMYIGNAKGTAWIEISDDGIDVFSTGKISMHSKSDINFHADGDFNVDAVSINLASYAHNVDTLYYGLSATSINTVSSTNNLTSDTLDVNVSGDFNRTVVGESTLKYEGGRITYLAGDSHSSTGAGTDFGAVGCPVRGSTPEGCTVPASAAKASAGIGFLTAEDVQKTGTTALKWKSDGTITTATTRVPQHAPWSGIDAT